MSDKNLTCDKCGKSMRDYKNENMLVQFFKCEHCNEIICGKCVEGGFFRSDKCPDCNGRVTSLGYAPYDL